MSAISLFTAENNAAFAVNTSGRQVIYLEDNVVPVIAYMGDSTAVGLNGTAAGSRDVWENTRGNAYPVEPGERTTYGYYWDQWLTLSGTTLDRTNRVSTTPPAHGWQKLFPHLGGNSGGDYKTDDGPEGRQMTPLWQFAKNIYGLFRRADQTIVAPYFITFGAGTATSGANGINSSHFGTGGVFRDVAIDTYLVDAVNNLITAGKQVAFSGFVSHIGPADAVPAATMVDTTDVNLKALRRYIENLFPDQTAFPWLQIDAYLPDPSYVAGGGAVSKERIRQLFNELRAFTKTEESVSFFDYDDVELGSDGVHPTALGNIQLGRKVASAYRELLATVSDAAAPLITTSI